MCCFTVVIIRKGPVSQGCSHNMALKDVKHNSLLRWLVVPFTFHPHLASIILLFFKCSNVLNHLCFTPIFVQPFLSLNTMWWGNESYFKIARARVKHPRVSFSKSVFLWYLCNFCVNYKAKLQDLHRTGKCLFTVWHPNLVPVGSSF